MTGDKNKKCVELASLTRTAVGQCPGVDYDWCAPKCMTTIDALTSYAEKKKVTLDECAPVLLLVKGSVGLLQMLGEMENCRNK